MKMKRIIRLLLLLMLVPIFGVSQVANGVQQEGSIDFSGKLGPDYRLEASNFHIHVREVPKMDICKRANATVYESQTGNLNNQKINVLSSTVQNKPGKYDITLGIEKDASVKKTIHAFVYDDNTLVVGSTIIFSAQDFSMKFSEKHELTNERAKKLAQVEAYDIPTGRELTSEVQTDAEDLENYIKATDFSVKDMKFNLWVDAANTREKAREKVSKLVKVRTTDDSRKLPDTDGQQPAPMTTTDTSDGTTTSTSKKRGTLPRTGERFSYFMSASGLVVILGILYFVYLHARRKKDE